MSKFVIRSVHKILNVLKRVFGKCSKFSMPRYDASGVVFNRLCHLLKGGDSRTPPLTSRTPPSDYPYTPPIYG